MQLITNNAIYNYNEIDSDIIKGLEDKFNKNLDDIYNYFEYNERHKPTITIIPTKNEWDKLMLERHNYPDGKVPNWLVGLSTNNDEIYLLSIKEYDKTTHRFNEDDYDSAFRRYLKTALHEYIHFIHKKWIKSKGKEKLSIYTCEGIAQLLSKQEQDINVYINCDVEKVLSNVNYKIDLMIIKYIDEFYSHDIMLDILLDNVYARNFLREHFNEIKDYYNNKKDQNKTR